MENKTRYESQSEINESNESQNYDEIIKTLQEQIALLEKERNYANKNYHEQLSETFKYKNAFKALVEEIVK